MFVRNEIVRVGNSSAKVKYYDAANNIIVLYDIVGTFAAGQTIVGDITGGVLQLQTFTQDSEANDYYYDLHFDDWPGDVIIFEYVVLDDGSDVVLDEPGDIKVTL
jgi:hypothetical protein